MLMPFSSFFALARENIFIKMHNIQIRFVTEPGKYTVCRRVYELFCPEILQAGAVKGLKWLSSWPILMQESLTLFPHLLGSWDLGPCQYIQGDNMALKV